MASSESEDIRKSLKPIFLSSWVFGVPRVSYKCIFRIIYSAFVLAIYLATFAASMDNRMNIVIGTVNIAMVIFYASSQIVTLIGAVGTILFWISKGARASEDAIMRLAELDIELKSFDIKVKHQDVIRRQIKLLALFFITWTIIIIMQEYVYNLSGVNDNVPIYKIACLAYSSHIPHLLILLGELVFSTIMFTFYQRFKWINESLMETSKNEEYYNEKGTFRIVPATNYQDLSVAKVNSRDELLLKIERLYKIHQRLCEITEKVSSSFSWQLYSSVTVTFCLLVYRLVVLYSLGFMKMDKLVIRYIQMSAWAIFYILKFWMITMTCCDTSDEANKLAIRLYEIPINDRKFHKMLHEYSVQLCRNKLHFTAGGFFSIDLSLVNTLISHVTTFILVFVDVWTGVEEEFNKSGNSNTTIK